MVGHEGRDHAALSASGSHRWLHCTPSVLLEERYGVQGDTTYAEEGTKAHELAECYIKRDLLHDKSKSLGHEIAAIKESDYYDREMEISVGEYVERIREIYEAAKSEDDLAELITEQRVDLRDWVPESFGTTDCTVIANGRMVVIDLKYGKGVRVDAEGNPQLRLYALGSYKTHSLFYDIKTVTMVIIQPRIDHISMETIGIDELLDWAEKEVKPKAKEAFAGDGELSTGDWCQFCKMRSRCRKLYEENIERAKECFGDDPRVMTDADIADVVTRGDSITGWINAVVEYATSLAVNEGKTFEGLKLVRGRSVRKWADEEHVPEVILARFPGLTMGQLTKVKMVGIGDVEKLVGKKTFNERLEDLTVKPEGKLTLVPLSDKRPAANQTDEAKEAFANG